MRELVYVSKAKLQQLVRDLPEGSRRLRDMEVEVKTPLGGVKVGKNARESQPGLAAAVAELEASTRAPLWFADPAARPGNWVHFEAPLSYCNIGGGTVVFLDADEASAEYPSGGRLRLVLHGSHQHIVGEPVPSAHRELDPFWLSSSVLDIFIECLKNYSRALDETSWNRESGSLTLPQSLERDLSSLTGALQPRYTAAWMAGYARITAVVPADNATILAATPLYVEHVAPPGNSVEPAK
jgi:hypothetical protein